VIAIVLAGGLGTRLRSVAPDGPKCMSPVAGRPFLEHVLCALHSQSVSRFVFAIGYRGAPVRAHFGSGGRFGVRIEYSDDGETLRGTGGALAHALETIPGTAEELILVTNGDTWVDMDLELVAEAHLAREALLTLVVAQGPVGAAVQVGPDHRVTHYGPPNGSGLVSAGVYLATRGVLEDVLPSNDRPASLEQDVLPRLVGRMYAVVTSGRFVDIGTPAELHRAQALLAGGSACR